MAVTETKKLSTQQAQEVASYFCRVATSANLVYQVDRGTRNNPEVKEAIAAYLKASELLDNQLELERKKRNERLIQIGQAFRANG